MYNKISFIVLEQKQEFFNSSKKPSMQNNKSIRKALRYNFILKVCSGIVSPILAVLKGISKGQISRKISETQVIIPHNVCVCAANHKCTFERRGHEHSLHCLCLCFFSITANLTLFLYYFIRNLTIQ
jgi:hypothetical protein